MVDTIGNITFSLIVGTGLDYYASGLRGWGIVTSRAYATGVNAATGGLYGMWRNLCFRITNTTEKEGGIYEGIKELYQKYQQKEEIKNKENLVKKVARSSLVDLLAFNTFQVPVYATAVAMGSLVSEGKVDWEKVQQGATYLAEISPLIGPAMGLYLDGFRKLFKVKTAAEQVYHNNSPS